jgi:hypothetical protein
MQKSPPKGADRRGGFGLALASITLMGVAALLVPASSAHGLRQLDRPIRAQIGSAFATPEGTLRWGAAPTGFWGGEYTTRSNEQVTLYTSKSYAVDDAANQRWADFLGGLIHGSELSTVTVYFATPVEADRLCSGALDLMHNVLGCYGSNTIVAPGEDTARVSAESVLTHEYGHHIAANRSNAPWRPLEWGAKRWASAMNICAMTRSHVVFPGDESLLYRLNPGEGFAETYRWVNERVEGDPIGTWDVLDTWLYPGHSAIQAIADDVLHPWTANRTTSVTGRFTARGSSVRRFRFTSGLDGTFTTSATGEPTLRIAILDGRKILARGQTSARATICGGIRAFTVQVTRTSGTGSFRLETSLP